MGSWQGYNYEEIPLPEDPKQANTQQRRADIYHRIKELGHPSLFDSDDKRHYARKYDVSYRQIHYDLDAIKEFVVESMDLNTHLTNVTFVFDKAMSEAIDEGRWDEAADIAMQKAEWLEDRGIIENESTETFEHEHKWQRFLEAGDQDKQFAEMTDGKEEIEVEAIESDE